MQRRKPVDKRIERQIITGMITNTSFLEQIIKMYNKGCFSLPFMDMLASWCIEYFENYKQAPSKIIQDLFLSKSKTLDDTNKEQIELLLSGLSEEYEQADTLNVDYLLDETEKHFILQKQTRLRDNLSLCLTGGRKEDADKFIADYCGDRTIRRPSSLGVDPIRDRGAIERAFSEQNSDNLFSMPGDLGFMIPPFGRNLFALIVASSGRGKTWWLQEIAIIALLRNFNVLFVSLEMSEKQMIQRIHHRLSGLPKERYSGEIWLPVFDCMKNQVGECDIKTRAKLISKRGDSLPFPDDAPKGYKACIDCMGMKDFEVSSWHKKVNREAITALKAIEKSEAIVKNRIKGAKFKLLDLPPNSSRFSDLVTMIDNMEYYEGWIPDVVITDYADKFMAEKDAPKEYRHRLYDISTRHKALAKQKHIFVVSASQSNTSRDEEEDVGAGGFAEDIRKKAEIDIGFSLNQTDDEEKRGIMRVSMMKGRDEVKISSKSQCIVLQQLRIGRPYLDSYWPHKNYFVREK
jgi:hypothetical protein